MPTVKELKDEAKQKGIAVSSKMLKDDLLKALGYTSKKKSPIKKSSIKKSKECLIRIQLEIPSLNVLNIFTVKVISLRDAKMMDNWVKENQTKKFRWTSDNGDLYTLSFSALTITIWDDKKFIDAFKIINSIMEISSEDLIFYIHQGMKF